MTRQWIGLTIFLFTSLPARLARAADWVLARLQRRLVSVRRHFGWAILVI